MTGALTGAVAALVVGAGLLAGCSDDPEPGVVQRTDAITAVVMWQADEQEPALDDRGQPQLPVIYIVSADGKTIDVSVQAAVTEATTDDAIVRFADDADDAFDSAVDGAPVHDGGVMLALGAVPEPAHSMVIEIDRYAARDQHEVIGIEVTATDRPAPDTDGDSAPRAEVTRATPR